MDIKAEYINTKEDWAIIRLMGSITLCYGRPEKKKWKAVAFKDPETAKRVANQLLRLAALEERKKEM